MTPPPISVVTGLRNSSIGRVAALLANRDDAVLMPELNLWMADTVGAWILMTERSQDGTGHGLLRAISLLYWGSETPRTIEAAKDWLWRRSDRSTLNVLDELRHKLSPRRMVIPDLNLGWRPNYMHALGNFAAFQLIHIVRHPVRHCRDITQSLSQDYFVAPEWRDFCDDPTGVVDPQIAWYRVHRSLIEHFVPLGDAYQRVLLEDLLNRIEMQRDRIWTQLGWPTVSSPPATFPANSPFLKPGNEAAVGGMENEVLMQPYLIQELRHDPPLDTVSDWRTDKRLISREVRALARTLGYNAI